MRTCTETGRLRDTRLVTRRRSCFPMIRCPESMYR
jgi:hypothetical protein